MRGGGSDCLGDAEASERPVDARAASEARINGPDGRRPDFPTRAIVEESEFRAGALGSGTQPAGWDASIENNISKSSALRQGCGSVIPLP